MWNSFGSFVRARRKRLGLTQRQLADALGLKSAAFLSDIEAGNRNPSHSLFPALARILETDIKDLLAYDVRTTLEEIRRHLETRPDDTAALGRILEAVRGQGAVEVLRRLDAYAEPMEAGPKKRRPPSGKKPAPVTDILGL